MAVSSVSSSRKVSKYFEKLKTFSGEENLPDLLLSSEINQIIHFQVGEPESNEYHDAGDFKFATVKLKCC